MEKFVTIFEPSRMFNIIYVCFFFFLYIPVDVNKNYRSLFVWFSIEILVFVSTLELSTYCASVSVPTRGI